MRGLRFRKGRNLPEVIQLVRRELGFMLRLCDLLGQAASLPPSLSAEGLGWEWVQAMAPVGASTRELPLLNAGNSLCLSLLSIPKWEFKF